MTEWWLIGGPTALAALRIGWSLIRRTNPLKPSLPLLDRAYGVATSATLLLFCRMESRQQKQVILDLIGMMERAGIAVNEIREYRRRYGNGSGSGTGSPFDSWIGADTSPTKASPTTPSSSASSDPNAPEKSKKNP